jgi:hypothetical protein
MGRLGRRERKDLISNMLRIAYVQDKTEEFQ